MVYSGGTQDVSMHRINCRQSTPVLSVVLLNYGGNLRSPRIVVDLLGCKEFVKIRDRNGIKSIPRSRGNLNVSSTHV